MLRVRKDKRAGGAGGVHHPAQRRKAGRRRRPVLRRGPVRGCQSSVQHVLQLGQAGEHPGQAAQVLRGCRRGSQGEPHAHLEGDLLRVRGGGRVQAGTAVRVEHHRQRGRAGGGFGVLPGAGQVRGAPVADGGWRRLGEGAHGHLHRARHPLRQVQAREAHGAPQALQHPHQHPQANPRLRGDAGLEGALLPLHRVRRVRQRRGGDDGAPRRVGAHGLQGRLRQGCQPGDLLQGARFLPRGPPHAAQRPAHGAHPAHRPLAGRRAHAPGQPPAPHQALPAGCAEHQPGRRQRRRERAVPRGGGLRLAPHLHRHLRQL